MSHRELDTFIIGFAIGSIACLWLGYRLRVRVERWQARRRPKYIHTRTVEGRSPPSRQDAKSMLRAPRIIPLERRVVRSRPASPSAEVIPIIKGTPHPADPGFTISPGWTNGHDHKWPAEIPIAPNGSNRDAADEAAKLVDEWRDAWPEVARISDNQMRELEVRAEASETARQIREDALAALTGAGYKRRDAEVALDSCTLVERAGGLESWVAAAFRRAASK